METVKNSIYPLKSVESTLPIFQIPFFGPGVRWGWIIITYKRQIPVYNPLKAPSLCDAKWNCFLNSICQTVLVKFFLKFLFLATDDRNTQNWNIALNTFFSLHLQRTRFKNDKVVTTSKRAQVCRENVHPHTCFKKWEAIFEQEFVVTVLSCCTSISSETELRTQFCAASDASLFDFRRFPKFEFNSEIFDKTG